MAKEEFEYPYSDEKGNYTFRTIGGRKVKIYEHQSLADAMIESGKFSKKGNMRENWRKEKNKDLAEEEELYKKAEREQTREAERERQEKFKENAELYPPQKVQSIDKDEKGLRETEREKKEAENKQNNSEYSLYKRAKERPESIDPMTENSTDWEALEKKYGKRYEQESKEYRTAKDLDMEENSHTEFIDEIKNNEKQSKEYNEQQRRKDLISQGLTNEEIDKGYTNVIDVFKDKENNALKNKDYSYDYSKETLSKMSDEDLKNYIEKQKQMNNEYTNKYNQDKTYDQRQTRNRQDTLWNKSMATKTERNLNNAQEELDKRNKSTNETMNNAIREKASNKILSDSQLRKMKWEDVIQANTEYFKEKSIYDFEGGRQGKYKYEDGWRDNGGAGVIKQSDLDRLIDKEDWERANKGYGRKYDSVDEAIADKDSALNQYIRNKANEKKALTNAWNKYKEEHPGTTMTKNQFKKDIYKK